MQQFFPDRVMAKKKKKKNLSRKYLSRKILQILLV